MDPSVDQYLNAINSIEQRGNGPIVFRSRHQSGYGFGVYRTRYQSGQGFLDVLKRIGRFALPFLPSLTNAASSVLSNISEAASSGQSIKDAVSKSARPIATNLVKDAAEVIQKKITEAQANRDDPPPESIEKFHQVQKGEGRKRNRRYKKPRRSSKRYKPFDHFNF
jgi:hypothetical protein